MTDLDLYDEYLVALDRMILAETEEECKAAEAQLIVAIAVLNHEASERLESKLRSIK